MSAGGSGGSRRLVVSLAAACVAVALPVGCGAGASDTSTESVTAAIERLQSALVANDYRGICAGVSRAAARQAGRAAHGDPTTCERDVRRLLRMIDGGGGWRHAGEPRVTDVRVDGSDATAVMALDEHRTARVPMTEEDGDWRLSGLFGAPPALAYRTARAIAHADFPPAGGHVAVTDGRDQPCSGMSEADYPYTDGGCWFEVESRVMPLTILTALGQFRLNACAIEYDVRVDSEGRTFTDDFGGLARAEAPGCGEIYACDYRPRSNTPWRGRLEPDGEGGFLHTMDMCLSTGVGNFIGDLRMRMRRVGGGWRVDPVDRGGDSGFQLGGSLDVEAEDGLGISPRSQN